MTCDRNHYGVHKINCKHTSSTCRQTAKKYMLTLLEKKNSKTSKVKMYIKSDIFCFFFLCCECQNFALIYIASASGNTFMNSNVAL